MSKKHYKKNKKVVETVVFQRKRHHRKPAKTTLFLFICLFLLLSSFYYLNFLSNAQNALVLAKENVLSSIQLPKEKNSHFVPVAVDIQNALTQQKKKPTGGVETNWLTKNIDSQPDHIIWHGPRDRKEVALTFDADMTPVMVDWLHSGQVATYNDTRITDFLIQNQIRATFFLTGLWIESYPNATKSLADNSLFELENHTYSHPSMAGYCFGQPQIPQSQYSYEIEKTQQLIEQYTHEVPKYFRFSGGCYDQYGLDLVKKEGLVTVHWDDVANDGFNQNKDEIITNVLSEVKNGSIIVMHLGGQPNTPETADALPTIIDGLKKKGYTFVTVSELLNPPVIATKIDPKQYVSSLESFGNLTP